jgi:hypothetical protein
VFAWFLYSALTCFSKVSVACVLRQSTWAISNVELSNPAVEADLSRSNETLGRSVQIRSETENRLFFYGVSTQLGSLLGSVITFVLVNIVVLFTASYPCQL